MKIGLYETILLLEDLGYTCVPLDGLKRAFFGQVDQEAQEPAQVPQAPGPAPKQAEGVYLTITAAKAAAKKGEIQVYDHNLGGFVNAPAQ